MCRAYNPTHNTSRLFIFYLLAQFIEKELEYYHHKLNVQDTSRVASQLTLRSLEMREFYKNLKIECRHRLSPSRIKNLTIALEN